MIGAHDIVDLIAACGDAGEMRGGCDTGFAHEPLHGRMRALARRTAGAIRHRHESWLQGREPSDRLPQARFHLLALRREEFEGDADVTARAAARESGETHQATSRCVRGTGSAWMRRSRASQSETVSLPPS